MDFSHFGQPSADWVQFIEANPRLPEVVNMDPKANRENWLKGVWKPTPPDVAAKIAIKSITVTTSDGHVLPGRLFYPLSRPFGHSLLPLYFYIHGGGFLHGNLEASDSSCARICAALGVVVCHIDYRHTDAWSYPTPYEDCWESFKYVIEHAEELWVDENKVLVGGESAGANLAIGVCVRAAKEGIPIKGQSLGSPFLCRPSFFPKEQIAKGKCSLDQHADEPGPTRDILEWFMELLDPAKNTLNYDVSPLLATAEQWRGLPKTYIQIAGMDPLRDEGILWANMLEKAGYNITFKVYPGLPHAFHHTDGLATSRVYDEDHDQEMRNILSTNI